MDIQYLLLLQNLREGALAFLEPIMDVITKFAVSPQLICIIALVYWVFDKKTGALALLGRGVSCAVNAFLKLSVCVYRPWVRDLRVLPAGDSKIAATSYSFPSGHSACATGYAGGLYYGYGRKHKWVAAILCAWILLTGFSRNFLGVHTPQDVVVGIGQTVLVLWLLTRIGKYIEKNPKKDVLVAGISVLVLALAIVFYELKPYPMDYTQEGKLLVDPKKMILDGYTDSGLAIGMIFGWLVERRFIQFKNEPKRVISYVLAALGSAVIILINNKLISLLMNVVSHDIAGLIMYVLMGFFIMAIMPFFFKLANKKS